MPKKGMAPLRKAQVMDAVFREVAEKGLEELTLDRVAARAGVSKGVVSYYFKNKKQLLLESFRSFLEGYNQEIMSRMEMDMTAREMAFLIIEACLAQTPAARSGRAGDQDHRPGEDFSKVLFHFFRKAMLDKDFQEVVEELYGGFFQGTRGIMEYGMATGEFRDTDRESAAYGLLAMLDGILIHRAMGFKPIDLDSARRLCRNYVKGLLASDANENKEGGPSA